MPTIITSPRLWDAKPIPRIIIKYSWSKSWISMAMITRSWVALLIMCLRKTETKSSWEMESKPKINCLLSCLLPATNFILIFGSSAAIDLIWHSPCRANYEPPLLIPILRPSNLDSKMSITSLCKIAAY